MSWSLGRCAVSGKYPSSNIDQTGDSGDLLRPQSGLTTALDSVAEGCIFDQAADQSRSRSHRSDHRPSARARGTRQSHRGRPNRPIAPAGVRPSPWACAAARRDLDHRAQRGLCSGAHATTTAPWKPGVLIPPAHGAAARPAPCRIFPKSKIQNQELTTTRSAVRDGDPSFANPPQKIQKNKKIALCGPQAR
jgi:hypothetical protein